MSTNYLQGTSVLMTAFIPARKSSFPLWLRSTVLIGLKSKRLDRQQDKHTTIYSSHKRGAHCQSESPGVAPTFMFHIVGRLTSYLNPDATTRPHRTCGDTRLYLRIRCSAISRASDTSPLQSFHFFVCSVVSHRAANLYQRSGQESAWIGTTCSVSFHLMNADL